MNTNLLIEDFQTSSILIHQNNINFHIQEFHDFLIDCYKKIYQFHFKTIEIDNINSSYITLFHVIPQPKNENMNILMFSAIYMIQKHLYLQYPEEQTKMDSRFYLDCYHVINYALNGIMVSDTYIESTLSKYFSDKYLDYQRKPVYAPPSKKPTKFFGQSISVPILDYEEGAEFAKTLSSIFKPYRRKLPQTEYEKPEIKYLHSPTVRKMKMNLHTVSPSMASALKITSVGNEKPKLINHPIQKSSLGDLMVLNKLKDLEDIRTQKPQPRIVREKKKNVVETHNLTYPPREYFQKHKKVDNLFKNILELNYVLAQRKETLANLPSLQAMQQRAPYFQKMEETYRKNNNFDLQLDESKQKEVNKFIIEELDVEQMQFEANQSGKAKFESQAGTTKGSLPQQDTGFTKFYKSKTHIQSKSNHLSYQPSITLSDNFKYTNKQKLYETHYQSLLEKESTDVKINDIQSKLAKQSTFLKRYMNKQQKRL